MLHQLLDKYSSKNTVQFRKYLAMKQSVNAILASIVVFCVSAVFFLVPPEGLDGLSYCFSLICYFSLIISSALTIIFVFILKRRGEKYWKVLEFLTVAIFILLAFWGIMGIQMSDVPIPTENMLVWAITTVGFGCCICITPLISVPMYMIIALGTFINSCGRFTFGEIVNCICILIIGVWSSISRFWHEFSEYHLLEEKDSYIARISHEIRTPINTIIGSNELIKRECEDVRILEYSQDISSAGAMLLSLINDILDLAKIESGKMKIVEDEYSLSQMVHSISVMIKSRAEQSGLTYGLILNDDLPDKLYGDEIRVKQIVMNLLTNAVKYTDKGAVVLRVEGAVNDDKVMLVFHVNDTGIGIRKEDIKKLQNSFYRIEEKRNHRIEGTGLGLNIVAGLLEAMNGQLSVTSEYGVGSEFIVSIPQKVLGSQTVKEADAIKAEEPRSEEKKKPLFYAPDADVLVVDDNTVNLLLFKRLLGYTKVNVTLAVSGEEMLEAVKNDKYHIIFLDHLMPGMDGIETLKKMREIPNLNENTPVIALTANERNDGLEFYKSFGFDDYLSKPIDIVKLEEMVKEYLPKELVTVLHSELSNDKFKL